MGIRAKALDLLGALTQLVTLLQEVKTRPFVCGKQVPSLIFSGPLD